MPGNVDLLIGIDCKDVHRCIREIHTNGPDARLYALCWTIAGPFSALGANANENTFRVHKIQRIRHELADKVRETTPALAFPGTADDLAALSQQNAQLTQLLHRAWAENKPPAPTGFRDTPENLRLLERMRTSVK